MGWLADGMVTGCVLLCTAASTHQKLVRLGSFTCALGNPHSHPTMYVRPGLALAFSDMPVD